MSVLIKGMNIRDFYDNGGEYAEYLVGTGQAISVPNHGDLIDRDEIFMQLRMDFAVIERMASEARAMAKDYLDGEKIGMGKAMIRVYEHEATIPAERGEE